MHRVPSLVRCSGFHGPLHCRGKVSVKWFRRPNHELRRTVSWPFALHPCNNRESVTHRVSRILSSRGARAPGMDNHSSLRPTRTASAADMPEARRPGRFLCGLAPEGVCRASAVTSGAAGSYPAVSPLPPRPKAGAAVCSLWHCPFPRHVGRGTPGCPGHPVCRCPDFPLQGAYAWSGCQMGNASSVKLIPPRHPSSQARCTESGRMCRRSPAGPP